MLRVPAFIGIVAWLAHAGSAAAGAWTRAPDTSFTAQSTKFFTTELTGDDDLPFRKIIASSYIEYGLYESVTIGGKLDYAKRADGAEESFASIFVRSRLWQADNDVLSVEIGGGYPVLDALAAETSVRDVTPDIRIGFAYGRGLPWDAGAWAEAAITFRKRLRSPADEVKLDLMQGYCPTDEIVLIGQMFGTLGLRNEGPFGANYDALKFSLSAGYRVTETRTLLLVVAQDVLGRNFDLGTEFGFTIWNTF
jgi:hypothetical protein